MRYEKKALVFILVGMLAGTLAFSSCTHRDKATRPDAAGLQRHAEEKKAPAAEETLTFTFRNPSPDYLYYYVLFWFDHKIPHLSAPLPIAGGELKPRQRRLVVSDCDPGRYKICWRNPKTMNRSQCWWVQIPEGSQGVTFTPLGEIDWLR